MYIQPGAFKIHSGGLLLKKLKYFELTLNVLNFRGSEKMYNLDWFMQISFFELPNHISRLTY